jgi:hypothetical protein
MPLTLVSFYGRKPPLLERLICDIQEQLGSVEKSFSSYTIDQVHGTVIGLEGIPTNGGILSEYFLKYRRESRVIDFDRLLEIVRTTDLLPLDIQVGGFKAGTEYGFRSRREHPHVRSFSIQDVAAICVGWPLDAANASRLDSLRRRLQQANVLHKYHRRPADVDNDMFFVLGRFARPLDELTQSRIERCVRQFLAARACVIPLRADDLSIVSYVQTELPTSTSQAFPVTGPSAIRSRTLQELYSRAVQVLPVP